MEKVYANKKMQRYPALDGLRAYSAIGIIMMHVLKNGGYVISSSAIDAFISSLGNLVYLFMVMSAFSMCCGYYERFFDGSISLEQFYTRRFKKMWGFFALICLIDIILSPSKESIYELVANLTLCFGLLPNTNMSVVGVGWFLGLIFVFYLIFPFFCFLLYKKQRAWFALLITGLLNVLCRIYFMDASHVLSNYDSRANIIYVAMFFVAGGLLFLYKDFLEKNARRFKVWSFILCIVLAGVYFSIGEEPFAMLALAVCIMVYAIGNTGKILSNRFTQFIGSISLEIYLCHMMFYRLIEKLHLCNLFGNGMASYVITVLLTFGGTVIFSYIVKKVLGYWGNLHNV